MGSMHRLHCSYGFRRGRSAHQALEALRKRWKPGAAADLAKALAAGEVPPGAARTAQGLVDARGLDLAT